MHRFVALEEHMMLFHQFCVAFFLGDLVPAIWFNNRPEGIIQKTFGLRIIF